jgi:hypothetical protein
MAVKVTPMVRNPHYTDSTLRIFNAITNIESTQTPFDSSLLLAFYLQPGPTSFELPGLCDP